MKALVYHGRGDIRCDEVPDPRIEDGRDAILRVTACAICGSDLHLMGGFVPEMKSGDVLGHECMGEVVEVGRENKRLRSATGSSSRSAWPAANADMCRMELYSCCERSNRNGKEQANALGYGVAGALGYSHLTGGYAGGQANTFESLSRTLARSSCQTATPMSRCCFCPTSFRPATWLPRTVTSRRARPSLFWDAGRSACSQSCRGSSWALSASSPLTQ